MNWDDPAARGRLLEQIGADAYNERLKKHQEASTIETVNGYAIRPVASRFGRLFAVAGTNKAFPTLDQAKDFARSQPPAPKSD
jgi:hypothetical protein